MPKFPKKDFTKYFVGANPQAVELLEKLLVMDPDRRLTAEQALAHPYFVNYADPEDEVSVIVCQSCDTSVIMCQSCDIIRPWSCDVCLQPTSAIYDDSFEKLDLSQNEWKSESMIVMSALYNVWPSCISHS